MDDWFDEGFTDSDLMAPQGAIAPVEVMPQAHLLAYHVRQQMITQWMNDEDDEEIITIIYG